MDVVYVQPRKGRPEQVIQLREVWKKLERGQTLAIIAMKHGICSKTLSEALRRVDAVTYEEIKDRRRRENAVLPIVDDVWKRLEDGEKLETIAKKCNVSHRVISSVLKRNDHQRYEGIMRSRRRRELNLPVGKLWKKLERGNTVAAIAKEYNVRSNTLAHLLGRVYGEKYHRIVSGRRRVQAIDSVIPKVWIKLEQGTSLTAVAERYGISRTTLARILRAMNKREYRRLVTIRSRRELSLITDTLPIGRIWRELDHGHTVVAIAKKYHLCSSTLTKILRIVDEKRYIEMTSRRRNAGQYGSLEARKHGADSAIELKVRELLEDRTVHFGYHCNLTLKGHRYQPDFMFEDNTILEVTGLTTRRYWSHCRRKINDYVEAGYRVFMVLPDYMFDVVRRYLPRHDEIRIMEYKDFERQIAEFLKQINADTR